MVYLVFDSHHVSRLHLQPDVLFSLGYYIFLTLVQRIFSSFIEVKFIVLNMWGVSYQEVSYQDFWTIIIINYCTNRNLMTFMKKIIICRVLEYHYIYGHEKSEIMIVFCVSNFIWWFVYFHGLKNTGMDPVVWSYTTSIHYYGLNEGLKIKWIHIKV